MLTSTLNLYLNLTHKMQYY